MKHSRCGAKWTLRRAAVKSSDERFLERIPAHRGKSERFEGFYLRAEMTGYEQLAQRLSAKAAAFVPALVAPSSMRARGSVTTGNLDLTLASKRWSEPICEADKFPFNEKTPKSYCVSKVWGRSMLWTRAVRRAAEANSQTGCTESCHFTSHLSSERNYWPSDKSCLPMTK